MRGLRRATCVAALAAAIVWSLGSSAAGADPPHATTFSGSCTLSGAVTFEPPLTGAPRTGAVLANASGHCTGTLRRAGGSTTHVAGVAARAIAESRGLEACELGLGAGTGYLDLAGARISFSYREVRTGPALVLRATGAHGGSAVAEGNVSTTVSPLPILAACASKAGLPAAPIDLRLVTAPSLAG